MPARLAPPASSSTTDPGYRGASASCTTPATPRSRSSTATSCRTRRSPSGPSGSLRMTVRPGRNSLVMRVRSLECTISARRNGSGPGRAPLPLASIGHPHTAGPSQICLPHRPRPCNTAVRHIDSLFSERAVGVSTSIWGPPSPGCRTRSADSLRRTGRPGRLTAVTSDDVTQDRLDIRSYIDIARKHGKNAHRRPARPHARQALATASCGILPVTTKGTRHYPSPRVNGLNAYRNRLRP